MKIRSATVELLETDRRIDRDGETNRHMLCASVANALQADENLLGVSAPLYVRTWCTPNIACHKRRGINVWGQTVCSRLGLLPKRSCGTNLWRLPGEPGSRNTCQKGWLKRNLVYKSMLRKGNGKGPPPPKPLPHVRRRLDSSQTADVTDSTRTWLSSSVNTFRPERSAKKSDRGVNMKWILKELKVAQSNNCFLALFLFILFPYVLLHFPPAFPS